MKADNNFKSISVKIDNINYSAGDKKILNDVSLDIKGGETTGILGPNGAGKTTLLMLLAGLNKPQQGAITTNAKDIVIGNQQYRRMIGVVMQETALYDELSVYENLAFSASLYAIEKPKDRIYETLELLGLASRAHDAVGILSGGLQRRVSIARSLIHNPQILIIDEPTLGVDVDTRHAVWKHLRFLRSTGTTIIVSTNYLEEALSLCDTVAVLKSGSVVVSGVTPQFLVDKTGYCIDLTYDEVEPEELIKKIAAIQGVIRIEKIQNGVSVFVQSDASSDMLLREIVDSVPLRGFRTRAADLSEVFHSLNIHR